MISFRPLLISLMLMTSFIYSQQVQLGFGSVDVSNGVVEVTINNDIDVAGFQFDFRLLTLINII